MEQDIVEQISSLTLNNGELARQKYSAKLFHRHLNIKFELLETVSQLTSLPKPLTSTITLVKDEKYNISIEKVPNEHNLFETCMKRFNEKSRKLSELSHDVYKIVKENVESIQFWNSIKEKLPETQTGYDIPLLLPIEEINQMTAPDAVKKTLLIELNINESDKSSRYISGDSFAIFAPNDENLVVSLLERLHLHSFDYVQIETIQNSVSCSPTSTLQSIDTLKNSNYDSSSASFVLKEFKRGNLSLKIKDIFKYLLDISIFPKKAMLRAFGDHCSNLSEKKYLYFLSSREGSIEYLSLKDNFPTIMDWLEAFPSCQPSLSFLIEFLSPLMPRYYSIASSPLRHPSTLKFCFNVTFDILSNCILKDDKMYLMNTDVNDTLSREKMTLIERKGHCSGWLETFLQFFEMNQLKEVIETLHPYFPSLPVLFKKNETLFKLPENLLSPLILIATGTGIAPLIGFLEHRYCQKIEKSQSNPNFSLGPIWVFFGCRSKEKDYLFQKELEQYHQSGTITKLLVAFSRDNLVNLESAPLPLKKHYVQNDLMLFSKEIYEIMIQNNGYIYLCG